MLYRRKLLLQKTKHLKNRIIPKKSFKDKFKFDEVLLKCYFNVTPKYYS